MKILIISYYWPPSSGSGVQRWMYFGRYLKDKGHDITVLTVDPAKASYGQTDESFSAFVEDLRTETTNTLEPLKLYSLLTTGNPSKGIPQGHVSKGRHGIFGKISNFIRANFFVPDARVGWVNIAYRNAKKIVKSKEFDAMVTTGPPHSSHLIGLKIKSIHPEIKWLADFRDPWKELFLNQDLPRINIISKYDENLEKKVISQCDHLLCVSPTMRQLLIDKKYKSDNHISFIINGFDSEKMKNISRLKKDKFTLSFIGLVADSMHFDNFISALNNALESQKLNVEIELAGKNLNLISEQFNAANKLISVLDKGFVSHIKAMEIMKSANIVFTVLAESKHDKLIVSGKLMEYLASGTPVLVVGNSKGDAAKILAEFEYARVFDQSDIDGMTTFISKIMVGFNNKQILRNNTSEIGKYSRRSTADQLEKLLHTI